MVFWKKVKVIGVVWAKILGRLTLRGWGSLWGQSSFVPWFSPYAFRDVSEADPEWFWINGFKRNSSSRDRAPKLRISLLLNSLDNFFLTLPSISSETCLILSFCVLGTVVFCASLLPGCSSWFSLLRASSFHLFLKTAICYGKITNNGEYWITFDYGNQLDNKLR